MSDTVIRVENLGKKYIIGHQADGAYQYTALRDVVTDGIRAIGQTLRHPGKSLSQPTKEEFWALKDVSFEVKQGEVIGIIGRNGAGKSTLLKILSRITEPTTGRIHIKGRVASLLEVGTGFHPELTGRENIFLNGAILGMSRAEINRKFDEIVEFAEISRFLDTPVKRYSSGMYVRLAFAVAAHLEPEILVVDEVLAVGDADFQRKCLGKMHSISENEGRTVLFVSHNMAVISQLTQKCLFLEEGRKVGEGIPKLIIERYMKSSPKDFFKNPKPLSSKGSREEHSAQDIKFIDIKTHYSASEKILKLSIEYTVTSARVKSVVAIRIDDAKGIAIATTRDTDSNPEVFNKTRGNYRSEVDISIKDLVPGIYHLTFSLADMHSRRYELLERAYLFEITDNAFDLTPGWSRDGALILQTNWHTKALEKVQKRW